VADLGAQGLFTKEIQVALLAGRVDVAVHSLKDLPTLPVEGLTLAAVPMRENPADALVTRRGEALETLPAGARVGTGSLRRRAQVLSLRPDLEIVGIRGNVDTRLRKVESGECDAIVLAAAGLIRLGWEAQISDLLEPPRVLPAPGQGALGLECRADDAATIALVAELDHAATRVAVTAERAILAALHGGCSVPVAAWGRVEGGRLLVDALVADIGGREVLRASGSATLAGVGAPGDQEAAASELGRRVADDLLRQGAAAVIAASRGM
jgi:hydroxymethylbilane synthase